MKLNFFLASSLLVTAVSAFQSARPVPTQRVAPLNVATMGGTIDLSETAQRDVWSLQQWAQQCGCQMAEGFEIVTQDGEDYSVVTNAYMPAGTPVLFVPGEMILTSRSVEQEFGGSLISAENALDQYQEAAKRKPLFRLMVKVLFEYEKGVNSPYYPWLNSLPRRFYNGVAMTQACFDCLPPYAGWLAEKERRNFEIFWDCLKKGYLPLDQNTIYNEQLVNWAYNVALTRFNEVWTPKREKKIAPMADMFNHGTNANVVVTYDDQGNALATTSQDVPAGSPLTISLGDPTNPTPLFATYGFLYNDCPTLFCKAMHLKNEIDVLGYDFRDLLFYTETGEIAPKVWDIFLYKLLENDTTNRDNFYVACKTNDEENKAAYHGQYFPYTLQALKDHVDGILRDVEQLSYKAQNYDLATHPRVPVILAHNQLVSSTFSQVKAQLDMMG